MRSDLPVVNATTSAETVICLRQQARLSSRLMHWRNLLTTRDLAENQGRGASSRFDLVEMGILPLECGLFE